MVEIWDGAAEAKFMQQWRNLVDPLHIWCHNVDHTNGGWLMVMVAQKIPRILWVALLTYGTWRNSGFLADFEWFVETKWTHFLSITVERSNLYNNKQGIVYDIIYTWRVPFENKDRIELLMELRQAHPPQWNDVWECKYTVCCVLSFNFVPVLQHYFCGCTPSCRVGMQFKKFENPCPNGSSFDMSPK